ncbi:MAG: hypothetical protein KF912_09950 [Phycisphaeraceae bacterium]|nr:hypothetical protein [Phycisphaeraceae bacterium]
MTGTDRDILISRVIDGEASPEDWSALKALAERDPSIWRDLAGLQQDHAELSGAMAEVVAIADDVVAPVYAAGGISDRARSLRMWGGWAAAAALALAWIVRPANQDPYPNVVLPTNHAALSPFGLSASSQPDDYFDAYLRAGQQEGRVLGEVGEPLLVQTIPQEGGGYEVRYVRQIMERRIVPQVYGIGLGYDERGEARPILIPVTTAPGRM